jgi:acyl dehydratase
MIYFETIQNGESPTLGPVSASAEQVIDFARRYDPQPFHLSDAGARDTIFGSLAASGWHTAAMALQLLLTGGGQPLAHCGVTAIENLRWRRPVYPDDALYATAEVASVQADESSVAGTVAFELGLRNQNDVQVFCARVTVRIAKRPGNTP